MPLRISSFICFTDCGLSVLLALSILYISLYGDRGESSESVLFWLGGK